MVSGAGAPAMGFVAYTVALFLLFLLWTFPHEAMLQRAIDRAQQEPVRIEVRHVTIGWPLAYRIGEVRITAPGTDPSASLLVAQQLRVAPSLLGLLRGSPYPAGLHAELYGGSLTANVDLRTNDARVDATLTDLDLARYSGLGSMAEGAWRGRVSAQIGVHGDRRKPARVDGTVSLRGASLAVESAKVRGIAIPDLHFSDIRVGGTIKSGRLEVTEILADGQELAVRGMGSIVLRTPLAASTLALDLTITPTAAASDGLRLALALLPGSSDEGGARTVRLGGTLGQPRAR